MKKIIPVFVVISLLVAGGCNSRKDKSDVENKDSIQNIIDSCKTTKSKYWIN